MSNTTRPGVSLLGLTWTCGAAPVQVEGELTTGAEKWALYFRARGEHWQCGIAATMEDATNATWQESPPDGAWATRGEWGDEPFAASWMDDASVLRLIAQSLEAYNAANAAAADGDGEPV